MALNIENSLLCFIKTARNARSHLDIINSTANFYDGNVILDSKKLLFECTGRKYTEPRMSARNKMNSSKKIEHLEDILKVFVECEAAGDIIPNFLASAWNSMPIISADYDPVAKQLSCVTNTIGELQSQLMNLLNENKNRSCTCKNDLVSLKQDMQTVKNYIKNATDKDNQIRVDRVIEHVNRESNSRQQMEIPYNNGRNAPSYANVAASPSLSIRNTTPERASPTVSPPASILVKNPNIPDNFLQLDIPASDSSDDDPQNKWVEYHKKTPRRPEACLIARQLASQTTLRAAPKSVDIFVGNCIDSTEIEDIKNFCVEKHNIALILCRKLNSKIPHRESFKISVSEKDSEILLNKNSWPVGIFPRKFVHVVRNNL